MPRTKPSRFTGRHTVDMECVLPAMLVSLSYLTTCRVFHATTSGEAEDSDRAEMGRLQLGDLFQYCLTLAASTRHYTNKMNRNIKTDRCQHSPQTMM